MKLGSSRVIKLLLATLLLTLLQDQSQAFQPNYEFLANNPGSKLLQSSTQVFGKDSNNNKISDSLEARLGTLGFEPIGVLIQTSNYQLTIQQLQRYGIYATLVSSILGQIKTDLSPQEIRFVATLDYIKIIELDQAITLIDPPKSVTEDYEFLDGHVDQNVKDLDPQLANVKRTLNATGGDGNATYSTADQVIAIVDTGIDSEHALLNNGKVIYRKNFVPDSGSCVAAAPNSSSNSWDIVGHGTRVASVAAGKVSGTNPKLSDGVAPGAALIDLKVFGCESTTDNSIINTALQWVLDNHTQYSIDVINLSLGSTSDVTDGTSTTEVLVNLISAMGIVVVVAAGNAGSDTGTITIPASAHHVISVGAMRMGANGESMASFTSKGPTSDGRIGIDILAPGADVLAARARGIGATDKDLLASSSGTSFSSPFVAGMAALALAANSNLRPSLGTICIGSPSPCPTGVVNSSMNNPIEDLLKQDCADWGAPGTDPDSGCGYIRPARSVQRMYSQTPSASYPTICSFAVTTSPESTYGFYLVPGDIPSGLNVMGTTNAGGFFTTRDWAVQAVRTNGTTYPLRKNWFTAASTTTSTTLITDAYGRQVAYWSKPSDDPHYFEIVARTANSFLITLSGYKNCPTSGKRWVATSNPEIRENIETSTVISFTDTGGETPTVLAGLGVVVDSITASAGNLYVSLHAPAIPNQQGKWKSFVMLRDSKQEIRLELSISDTYTAIPTSITRLTISPTGKNEGSYIDPYIKVYLSSDGRYVFYSSRSKEALGTSEDSLAYLFPAIIDLQTNNRWSPIVQNGAIIGNGAQIDLLNVTSDGQSILMGMFPGGAGVFPGDSDLWYEIFLQTGNTRTQLSLTPSERAAGLTSLYKQYGYESWNSRVSPNGQFVALTYPSSDTSMGIMIRYTDTRTASIPLDNLAITCIPKVLNDKVIWHTKNPALLPSGVTGGIVAYTISTGAFQLISIKPDGLPRTDIIENGQTYAAPVIDPSGRYYFFVDSHKLYKRDLVAGTTLLITPDRDFWILGVRDLVSPNYLDISMMPNPMEEFFWFAGNNGNVDTNFRMNLDTFTTENIGATFGASINSSGPRGPAAVSEVGTSIYVTIDPLIPSDLNSDVDMYFTPNFTRSNVIPPLTNTKIEFSESVTDVSWDPITNARFIVQCKNSNNQVTITQYPDRSNSASMPAQNCRTQGKIEITTIIGWDIAVPQKYELPANGARIPSIATPVPNSTGFTAQINNYDSSFTWIASASNPAATATVTSSGVLTITGLSLGDTTTATVKAAKTGYSIGKTTTALIAAAPYVPPAPAPAPEAPAGGGGGGGGGGAPKQTALYFQVVDPSDQSKIYSKSVCVEIYSRTLFPQFMGSGCSGADGRINVLVGDAKVTVRVFALGDGANFREYIGEVANDTFTLENVSFFPGTTRFAITLPGAKEVTPAPTPTPSPTPTVEPTPTPKPSPVPTVTPTPGEPIRIFVPLDPTPTPTPTPSPTSTKSNYFSTTTSTVGVAKVSIKASTTAISTKIGKTLQLSIPTIGTKTTPVKISVKDPAGMSYQIASVTVAKNKAYSAPIVKFAKAGTYIFTVNIGTTKKTVTVKVSK